MATRESTKIWLIGQVSPELCKTKLPTKKEVLSLFFYYKNYSKLTIKGCCISTANDVLSIWQMAAIPTQTKKRIKYKIEQMFNSWQKLKKNKENKSKRSEVLIKKEQHWATQLEGLFDIAHTNALNMIVIQEDKDFLNAQRQDSRHGKIGKIDSTLLRVNAKREKWSTLKEIREKKLMERQTKSIYNINKSVPIQLSSSSSDDDQTLSTLNVSEPVEKKKTAYRGRKKILNENLAVSLDVAKLSNPKAAIVLTETVKHIGADPAEYNISTSSIRRQRIDYRKNMAESLRSSFMPDVPLTIHWDGKMIEDISGPDIVERLPILVSGMGVDKLLGVPKLSAGTGVAAASAVFNAALEWNISEKIKCMSFDTTAANTGRRNGACILLEQKMDKDMLWLACRHHILEIMLGAVFSQAFGASTGPDTLIFKKFKLAWSKINKKNFKSGVSDPFVLTYVENIADDAISFVKNQLLEYQPRDDYKELLKLTLIFLGDIPETDISFRAPGGIHRARWMANAIYCLKMYLFRNEFKLTESEASSIRDVCIFAVRIYVKYWFVTPSAVCAPRNDLQLLKDLKLYEAINELIAAVAIKKVLGHLWYISEELVALAFFDNQVSVSTKKKMVNALDVEGPENPLKRITLDASLINSKQLEDFVSKNTLRFFTITGISSNFLKKNVEDWPKDEGYINGRNIVCSMRVVNDVAERGVALMEEYNKLHTNNEEQKQYLLLLVKEYRQKYPNSNKSTLLQ